MAEGFTTWIGQRREAEDRLDPGRPVALLAALGRPSTLSVGDPLPQLFHWLYFWDVGAPGATGADGHPQRGDFLPPIAAPRRMWAGGRLTFHEPLRLGDAVRRVSTIANIAVKEGRSGALTFVTLVHELHGPTGLAITEEQDLVYREPAPATTTPTSPSPAAGPEDTRGWFAAVDADPILLFRYSALSMNSHRIHYDRPYAVDVEGYRGLVVQGPLQATVMLSAAADARGASATAFRFRGLAPALCGPDLTVRGIDHEETTDLWATQAGVRTMEGVATFGAPA